MSLIACRGRQMYSNKRNCCDYNPKQFRSFSHLSILFVLTGWHCSPVYHAMDMSGSLLLFFCFLSLLLLLFIIVLLLPFLNLVERRKAWVRYGSEGSEGSEGKKGCFVLYELIFGILRAIWYECAAVCVRFYQFVYLCFWSIVCTFRIAIAEGGHVVTISSAFFFSFFLPWNTKPNKYLTGYFGKGFL